LSPGDEALSRRMRLFIDKAWGYGDPKPDHYFLAMNYRMTELPARVALGPVREAARDGQGARRDGRAPSAEDRGAPRG
jgi:hypothetical protein